MNRGRITVGILCVLLVLLLAACGSRDMSPEERALCGSWAYSHDPDTAVLTLKKSGRAVYEDTRYDYTVDGQFLLFLSGQGETLALRYRMEDGGMTLYIPSEYECEDTPESLMGFWECGARNWTFEFSADGTFREDSVFTGNYAADEENGTLTLRYSDYFEDTVCYYTLAGDRLTVEYPWRMVLVG